VIEITGLYGTHGKPEVDQVNVRLTMIGTPDFGIFLHYAKWDGRIRQGHNYFSKGDLRPIGLFIPYAEAWKAVKEFMERDGELPTGIEWVDGKDLPPNTFRFPGFFKPGPEPRVLLDEDINDQPPHGTDMFGFRHD